MSTESVGKAATLSDGLAHAENWLLDHSDLLVQYGVNII